MKKNKNKEHDAVEILTPYVTLMRKLSKKYGDGYPEYVIFITLGRFIYEIMGKKSFDDMVKEIKNQRKGKKENV